MNLKSLLTCLVVAIGLPMFAQDVACNVPGALPYENATIYPEGANGEYGAFVKFDTNAAGNYLQYKLNVETAGDYLLYLNVGSKTPSDHGLYYDVILNGNTLETVDENINYSGNWKVFIMKVHNLTLPAGESTLKILSLGDRWNMNPEICPMILPAPVGNTYAVGDSEADINVMYPAPASTLTFTSFAAFGVDNSGFGHHGSVLVSPVSMSASGKGQSPYPVSKLLYQVTVAKVGVYPVTIDGFFVPKNSEGTINDFCVQVAGLTTDGSTDRIYFDPVTYSGVSGSDKSRKTQDVTAEGKLYLQPGTYMLEVSAPNTEIVELFCMNGFTIGAWESEIVHSVEASFDEANLEALNNVPFTLTGSVDVVMESVKSVELFRNEEKVADLELSASGNFSYEESALIGAAAGTYNYSVSVTTESDKTATAEIVVTLVDASANVYTVNVTANEGGTVVSDAADNQVVSGGNMTFTITPTYDPENLAASYQVETVKVNGEAVQFTADANGVVTYTFENIVEDQTLEVVFSPFKFTITAISHTGDNDNRIELFALVDNGEGGFNENGKKATTQESNNINNTYTATGKFSAGSWVRVKVITKGEYAAESITLDGVDQPIVNGNASNTWFDFQVTGDRTVEAFIDWKHFTVTTAIEGKGTMTATPQHGKDGKVRYDAPVRVVVTPDLGWKSTQVVIEGNVGTNSPVVIPEEYATKEYGFWCDNVKSNVTITAHFEQYAYAVTTEITNDNKECGLIEVDKDIAEEGESVAVTVTPNIGFEVGQVLVNGVAQEVTDITGFDFTIENVTSDVNIQVTFTEIQLVNHTLTALYEGHDDGSVTFYQKNILDGTQGDRIGVVGRNDGSFTTEAAWQVVENTTVICVVKPRRPDNEIYSIDLIKGGETVSVEITDKTGMTFEFDMDAETTVDVFCGWTRYNSTIETVGEGTVTANEVPRYEQTFYAYATPAQGCKIVGVTVEGSYDQGDFYNDVTKKLEAGLDVDQNLTIILNHVRGNLNITVTFERVDPYTEGIVSDNNYFLVPDDNWLNAEGNYYAKFVNKNTNAYAWVVGEVTEDNTVVFYLSQFNVPSAAPARAKADEKPVYTHVTFFKSTEVYENLSDAAIESSSIAEKDLVMDYENNVYIVGEGISTGVENVKVVNNVAYACGVVTANGTIEVYNMNGTIVARGNNRVDLNGLAGGVYVVRCGNDVMKVVR